MNKEKMIKLTKYLNSLEDRLSSPVTSKWEHSPDTYRQFLKREISDLKKQLDAAKLEGVKK